MREFYSWQLAQKGSMDPLPTYTPPHEDPQTRPDLARRFPLQMLTPPVPAFLNSTLPIVASAAAKRLSTTRTAVEMHFQDADRPRYRQGPTAASLHDRGSFQARAVVGDSVKPGVVVSQGIFWNKYTPDNVNCNTTTSTRLTDLGVGDVF